MGRKVRAKKMDKLEIQKKQEEISNSINESSILNQKIITHNEELISEIDKKKEIILSLNQDILDISYEKEKTQKDHKKEKSKLEILITSLKDEVKKIESKLKELKELKSKLDNEKLKQLNQFKLQTIQLDKKINSILLKKQELDNINTDLKELNNRLSNDNTNLEKKISLNNKELDNKEIKNDKLNKENIKLSDINSSQIIDKELLKGQIIDLKADKKDLIDNISKSNTELIKTDKELSKANTELKHTKELNLKLIKREDRLNAREQHINGLYEKAGLKIK